MQAANRRVGVSVAVWGVVVATVAASVQPSLASARGLAAPGQANAAPQATDAVTQRAVEAAERALRACPDRLPAWSGALLPPPCPWPDVFKASRDSLELVDLLLTLEKNAQATLADPPSMYQRPATLDAINPKQLDPDALKLKRNRDAYALARADVNQSAYLQQQGVELAIVAAWRKDSRVLARALAMLDAFTAHAPLQRPGYTLSNDDMTLPPGGDGVWLATSWGIGAVVEMLNILGDQVPADLRARLEVLLRNEVELICRDWADKRPWFVKVHTPVSNQWLEPSLGLVRACMQLRDPALRSCYDLGVDNVAQTLRALGEDGAWLEGFSYASQSAGPLFEATLAVRSHGDTRLAAFPYLQNAWQWFAQMNLPASGLVNSYDSRMNVRPAWALDSPLPSEVSVYLESADPGALRASAYLFPKGGASASGIRYAAAVGPMKSNATMALPRWAHFPSQGQVVWRQAWERPGTTPRAMALWCRGGTSRETHVQRDNGQVSVVVGKRRVLMESGTPDYGLAGYESKYAGAAGHSVMQVMPVEPPKRPLTCPLTVESLSDEGGVVRMDLAPASTGVSRCTRVLRWNASGRVAFEDVVAFRSPVTPEREVYRFHTGSIDAVQISGAGAAWDVSWRGTTMALRADRPITIDQLSWPDAMGAPGWHQVIVVRCAAASDGLALYTTLHLDLNVVD